MPDAIEQGCAQIFRGVLGLAHPMHAWDDERLLAEPLAAIDVDSLSLLDFVMQVEEAFGIELNEVAVNNCRTVGELVAIVAAENSKTTSRADSSEGMSSMTSKDQSL
jgi:acyl carrier protein